MNGEFLHLRWRDGAPDDPTFGGELEFADETTVEDPLRSAAGLGPWCLATETGVLLISNGYLTVDGPVEALVAQVQTTVSRLMLGSTGGQYDFRQYRGGALTRHLREGVSVEISIGEPLPYEMQLAELWWAEQMLTEDRLMYLFLHETQIKTPFLGGGVSFTKLATPNLIQAY
ncbi:hypothetical protein FK529_02440 [Tsukamurella asaccharolytica]|uniref:Uncharacterized protein n=1 Tax=Tsukamurella asaccharolytica TaxID=2592067 RepID=A0A5C5RF54_9ACTN|nr:hypothetical protein [Tsukamurella asaccharolytica]TWS21470.1 hypothetical protein FK529_02440 [Tsukamurella asaccharolytica]